MTTATIGKWTFKLGDAASPSVLQTIEQVKDVSGVGQTNDLVEHTNFDSPAGTKEFTGGLSEGDEFTVTCNYVPGGAQQQMAMTAQEAAATRSFELAYTGSSPDETFTGNVVCIGYTPVPSVDGINELQLTYKISGGVTRA